MRRSYQFEQLSFVGQFSLNNVPIRSRLSANHVVLLVTWFKPRLSPKSRVLQFDLV